jgi:CRISPR system Cascade subunit CasE
MFLSRLSLADGATASPGFWRAFGDEYALHRSVWELFGDRPERDRDFLYRLDAGHGRPLLWTLSERPPMAPPSLWTMTTRQVAPDLRAGDLLEFDVRVNPVVCRDGKRHDVVMDRKRRSGWQRQPIDERDSEAEVIQAALGGWMAARCERLGVGIRRLAAEGYRVRRFRKPSGKHVQLGICDLGGVLQVREPERFLAAWRAGLGPAKGFGCGLMLIRRSRR